MCARGRLEEDPTSEPQVPGGNAHSLVVDRWGTGDDCIHGERPANKCCVVTAILFWFCFAPC